MSRPRRTRFEVFKCLVKGHLEGATMQRQMNEIFQRWRRLKCVAYWKQFVSRARDRLLSLAFFSTSFALVPPFRRLFLKSRAYLLGITLGTVLGKWCKVIGIAWQSLTNNSRIKKRGYILHVQSAFKAFQNTEAWRFSFWNIFFRFRDMDILLLCKLDLWWRHTDCN